MLARVAEALNVDPSVLLAPVAEPAEGTAPNE